MKHCHVSKWPWIAAGVLAVLILTFSGCLRGRGTVVVLPWAGVYDVSWGDNITGTMTLQQKGDNVTGVYTYGHLADVNGVITGDALGGTLAGTWEESNELGPWRDGTFSFELLEDESGFTGTWHDGWVGGPWSGTRHE